MPSAVRPAHLPCAFQVKIRSMQQCPFFENITAKATFEYHKSSKIYDQLTFQFSYDTAIDLE